MDLGKLIFTVLSKEEIRLWIKDSVKEFLQDHFLNGEPEVPKLLSRQEVAEIYSISLVTLRKWEVDSIIPKPIRKGDRVYFRKSDIVKDIENNK